MPTLEKRIEDGGFYIRHFFHENSTWQVLGEGVRVLRIEEFLRAVDSRRICSWISGSKGSSITAL